MKNRALRTRVVACAMLSAVVVSSGAFAQKAKPVVAIYQIDDVARSGQGETFSTMLETAIEGTNRFRVIERRQLDKLMTERAGARAGVFTTNTPGRTGGIEGADYLIYGSITSAQASARADIGANLIAGFLGGRAANPSCASKQVTLGVDIKITDAASGEVRYANHLDQSAKSATSCNGNAEIDTAGLLRSAADNVASGLVTAIYPIQIAAVTGDGYVLNYGQGTILPGQVLAVYAKGEAIRDPSSGEILSNSETRLGYVRVESVEGRVSKAVAITPFAASPPVGSTVRPATPAEAQAVLTPAKRR
jgi:curli biogenesis system outer membrane secretion channel CsgG